MKNKSTPHVRRDPVLIAACFAILEEALLVCAIRVFGLSLAGVILSLFIKKPEPKADESKQTQSA